MGENTETETEKSYTPKSEHFIREELITRMIKILEDGKDLSVSLPMVCDTVKSCSVDAWIRHVRFSFNNQVFQSSGFEETGTVLKHDIQIPGNKQALFELFLAAGQPQTVTTEAETLWPLVAPLIVGLISKIQYEKLSHEMEERQKELKSINRTAEILKKSNSLEELLQEVCLFLPEAMQYPAFTVTRIKYGDQQFTSETFTETPWKLQQTFDTPDATKGSIEIFYLKEFPEVGEGPFLTEERNLIDNLAALISGTVSRKSLEQLLVKNTERLKELRGINRTSQILQNSKSFEEALRIICNILPESWQYPEHTVARICYNGKIFLSRGFRETSWRMAQDFETPDKRNGTIEIFYLKPFPEAGEGPFLKEERNLLINLSNLIAGSAIRSVFNKLQHENTERLKELRAINQTALIIEEGKPVDATLQEICNILPNSWQYPKYTAARIRFEGQTYSTLNLVETDRVQRENFVTIYNKKGTIEIFYLKQFPKEDEGPFLHEERNLLINIARLVSGFLNNQKGREIIHQKGVPVSEIQPSDEFRKSLIRAKKPLQLYFNQQALDKYVYLDMMKYKVKHILFVATLYDAFILESEDSFFERFMGEIYQYSLFSVPRITGVSSAEEALMLLETTHFDLVILMAGSDRETPIILSEQIRAQN